MNQISQIRKISIWIFFLPVIVLNVCLFISVNYLIFENTIFVVDQIGRSGFTIPYIDGGVSISRTARTYPTYLIFKPGMIITAFLLIKYWIANNNMAPTIKNKKKQLLSPEECQVIAHPACETLSGLPTADTLGQWE